MQKVRSFSDHLTDWDRLLTAIAANADILPELGEVSPLLQVLNELRALTARQDSHRAGLKVDTRRLRELLVRGSDYTSQLRSAIRGHLGPRNAKLAEFRIQPLGRNRALPSTTEPPAPPPQGPE